MSFAQKLLEAREGETEFGSYENVLIEASPDELRLFLRDAGLSGFIVSSVIYIEKGNFFMLFLSRKVEEENIPLDQPVTCSTCIFFDEKNNFCKFHKDSTVYSETCSQWTNIEVRSNGNPNEESQEDI